MLFIAKYQIQLLFASGMLCLLLALLASVIKFHSFRKKSALIRLELGVAFLMFSDALAYHFDGNMASNAYWIVRVANFFVFTLTLADIYFLDQYITALYMETGKFAKLPKRLLIGYILPTVGISLVVLSQFNGLYYYIDANNRYQRGPAFVLSFLIPFVAVNLLSSFVVEYRHVVNKRLLWSIIVFSMLPIVAGLTQLLFYGVSFINFATCVAGIFLFICALCDQNEEYINAANTDMATGLPNTFGYIYEVEAIIHQQDITNYNSFYIDIVRMININNKYGRKIGDTVILKFADQVRKTLDDDEILGRLGGNFFVALVKKSHTESFLALLKDVSIVIDFEGYKETVHVSAIAGAYEITDKNIAAGQIIGYTSTAVTYAKSVAHKPYVFWTEELEKESFGRRLLEEKARKALANEEFVPFYQPKIDTCKMEISGAEALVRWNKDGKIVSPFEFIPIMEKNTSICDLDFYMLEHVCQDIRGWIDAGMEPVQVSVNFSRKNLGNPILAEAISNVVEKYDIPKELIQIEITETLDEFPLSYLIGVVEALQRYGLTVAIDDFGTGSSSIGLLKKVRFDVLKIDKSFVDYESEEDRMLIADIVHMAKHRNIEVIAEGVETSERALELQAMGCALIQGYVFDKPMDKLAFENRLEDKRAYSKKNK